MTMTKRNETLKRGGPFAAGVLIGLSVVTPVFAATLDGEALQPLILLGSLIVLLVGYVLNVVVTSRPSAPSKAPASQTSNSSNSSDMRFRGTHPAIDIVMPAHVMHGGVSV